MNRRNDRPAALARSVSGGWRAERSCCLARNAAAWRQGKKIANEPLRVKVGEHGEWCVIGQQKASMDVGLTALTGEQRLQNCTLSWRPDPTKVLTPARLPKRQIELHGYRLDIGLDGLPLDPNHPFNRAR